jgi:phage FluMu gp28-like protein
MMDGLPRNPDELPEELPRGAQIPEDLDPLAEGVLMRHQAEWLEDDSDLKLCAKGRRTGITFAEALDDTLVAAAKRSAGGQNVFYIGDTKDKGREFIGYVGHFGRVVAKELVRVEEFMFDDVRKDGSSKSIAAYRAGFASGYRIEALSSRPENIRGLQGIVVIDEAAFHEDIREVLDAVNALLIWGGKIRIISSHNGLLNPFNELIREVRATGRPPYSIHEIPFGLAVENGLYERTCLVTGATPTPDGKIAWEKKIRDSYGVRTAKMRQELDAVPADAEGAALTRVQIETRMRSGVPIVRWRCDDDFKNAPDHIRKADAQDFCERELAPLLEQLDPRRPHVFGEDFARSGDATAIVPMELGGDLVRRVPFVVELRNVPFDQQREILFYVVDRLPRLVGGACDATGNGAYLAEKAAQRYGATVIEVKLTEPWYKTEMPAYVEAFADGTILLPRDEDVLRDHQALQWVKGIIKVPDDFRFKGQDGFERHGDTAMAGALAWHASRADLEEFAYVPAGEEPDKRDRMFEERRSSGMDPSLRGGLY